MSQSQRTVVQSASCIGPDGSVICYHDVTAAFRTATTRANIGRPFYTCPIDDNKCKFFKWADDPIFTRKEPPAMTPTPSSSPLRPSQRQRAEQARNNPPSPIKTDGTYGQSTRPGPRSLSPIEYDAHDQPDQYDDDEIQTWITANSQPRSRSCSPDFELQSPKRAKRTHSPNPIATSSRETGLRTPPRTVHRPQRVFGSGPGPSTEPQTPTRNKGKGRQDQGPLRDSGKAYGGGAHKDDPFIIPDSPVRLPSSSAFSAQVSELTPESIEGAVEMLKGLPAYVQTLMRRQNAAQKSADAKMARIEMLTDEKEKQKKEYERKIRILEDKIRVMEATINSMKATRRFPAQ